MVLIVNSILDPAQWNAASYLDHPVDNIEPEKPVDDPRILALEFLFNNIWNDADPGLSISAAACAAGLPQIQGLNQSDIAKRHGVTRSVINKYVKKWRVRFGYEFAPGQRSHLATIKAKKHNRRWIKTK